MPLPPRVSAFMPDRILFVDDKEENIRAAEEFGMQGIIYSDHESFLVEMKSRGLEYLLNPMLVSPKA